MKTQKSSIRRITSRVMLGFVLFIMLSGTLISPSNAEERTDPFAFDKVSCSDQVTQVANAYRLAFAIEEYKINNPWERIDDFTISHFGSDIKSDYNLPMVKDQKLKEVVLGTSCYSMAYLRGDNNYFEIQMLNTTTTNANRPDLQTWEIAYKNTDPYQGHLDNLIQNNLIRFNK